MKNKLPAILLASALILSSSQLVARPALASSEATILSSVSFRSAPKTCSQVYYYLKKGEQVDIISKVNSYWYKVRDAKGNIGYVSSKSEYIRVGSSADSSDSIGTIVSSVRFRSAPKTSSDVYYYLKKGEQVNILSKVNNYWYKVKDAKGKIGYVSSNSQYIQVGSSSGGSESPGSNATVEKIIATGMNYLGTPYEFGSNRNTTTTFDCSDFVRHAFKEATGIILPTNSRTQGDYVKSKGATKTNLNSLQRGDLLFFMEYRGTKKSSYPSNTSGQRITHVGIYLGNGQMLHTYSKASGGVRIDTISNKHWEYRFIFGGSAL